MTSRVLQGQPSGRICLSSGHSMPAQLHRCQGEGWQLPSLRACAAHIVGVVGDMHVRCVEGRVGQALTAIAKPPRPLQLAHNQDVLAVTDEGMGGLFVNPSGYVHDVMAIRHIDAEKVMLLGRPSQEHSWFPGYAWTIANCGGCGSHLVGPPFDPRTASMTRCYSPCGR